MRPLILYTYSYMEVKSIFIVYTFVKLTLHKLALLKSVCFSVVFDG